MLVGDLNLRARRPSTPGSNQQLLFNQSGVDGANANLTFDYANNSLNVGGNIVVTQNISTGNLAVTQNINCNGLANIVQPTLVATRELLSNVGSINTPNTVTFNVAQFSDFDVTSANTSQNNINVAFTGWAHSGNLQTVTVIVRQSGAAANTAQTSSNGVNWTSGIKWSNGEVPVLAGFVGKCDVLTFTTVDGGTTIYGAHSMANCG